jgi:hypothetical protein
MIWVVVVLATLPAAVGGGIPAASTQAPIARARLEMRAPSDCTGPADLVARVAARSPRIQFVEDAAAIGVRATFGVVVSGGVSAELVMVESGVARVPRRLVTRTCAEAADAVALMIAIALDPVWVKEHRAVAGRATSEPEVTGSPDRAAGSPSAPPGTSPSTSDLAEKSSAKEPGRQLPPPQVSLPDPTVAGSTSTQALRARPRTSVHLAGQTIWGPAPAVMPGIAVYAVHAWDRDAFWSPAIAVGAFHAWTSDLAEPGGKAAFALDAATLDACALRLRASVVNVRACAAVLVGRLSASGSDTDAPASFAKLFAAAGAASVLTVDLGSRVELSARIGTGLTLWRDSFEFATTPFHTASRFTTSAGIGVGFRLW